MPELFKLKYFRYIFVILMIFIMLICLFGQNRNRQSNTLTSTFFFLSASANNNNNNGELRDRLPWWEDKSCAFSDSDNYYVFKGENKVSSRKTLEDTLFFYHWKETKGENLACGWKSWQSGYGQKVVSYSVYGNNPAYWVELGHLLYRLDEVYPGWQVRIYTDPREKKPILCPLLSVHSNLFICDVVSLPPPLGNITGVHPAMWRFAPLQDPMVDVVIVRDTDAMVLQREVDAVNEWLSSGKTLHVMRDHPDHGTQILGGMWGMRITKENRQAIKDLSYSLLKKGLSKTKHGYDQFVLATTMWPKLSRDMMSHDSYLCDRYPYTQPWPTQRQNGKFVGNADYKKEYRNSFLNIKCPVKCRPKNHQNWEYC